MCKRCVALFLAQFGATSLLYSCYFYHASCCTFVCRKSFLLTLRPEAQVSPDRPVADGQTVYRPAVRVNVLILKRVQTGGAVYRTHNY